MVQLISDPVRIVNGNQSRWNAAFNQITFYFQRRDFEISIGSFVYTPVAGGPSKTCVKVNSLSNVSGVQVGSYVYVKAGTYDFTAVVLSVSSSYIVVDYPYAADAVNGFMNSNSIKKYYSLLTKLRYVSPLTGQWTDIVSTNTPDTTGLIRVELSAFIQYILSTQDDSEYDQINFRDLHLSASYNVSYAENYQGLAAPAYTEIVKPYYVTYAARQLGQKYAGNMAEFVPFPSGQPLAKWICDFEEPVYTPGLPFDLSFIYSDNLLASTVSVKLTYLDINRQLLPVNSVINSLLLNEDGTFLLNEDGSRFIIAQQAIAPGGINIPERLGLNRLLINNQIPDTCYFIKVQLNIAGTPITEDKIIRVEKEIDPNIMYFRWIGLTGSWNYYRFGYNQKYQLDVQDMQMIKLFVKDWEYQRSMEKVISKSASKKVTIQAEDLSLNDVKGLESLKYSLEVQLLTSSNPIRWQSIVINTATFEEYETRYEQAPFKLTFNLPSLNIQTQ